MAGTIVGELAATLTPATSSEAAESVAGPPGVRVFVARGKRIPDPAPGLATREIQAILAEQAFPEIANAEIVERREGPDTIHEFVPRVGTKGLADGDPAAPGPRRDPLDPALAGLRRLPAFEPTIFDLAARVYAGGTFDVEVACDLEPAIEAAAEEARGYVAQVGALRARVRALLGPVARGGGWR